MDGLEEGVGMAGARACVFVSAGARGFLAIPGALWVWVGGWVVETDSLAWRRVWAARGSCGRASRAWGARCAAALRDMFGG